MEKDYYMKIQFHAKKILIAWRCESNKSTFLRSYDTYANWKIWQKSGMQKERKVPEGTFLIVLQIFVLHILCSLNLFILLYVMRFSDISI